MNLASIKTFKSAESDYNARRHFGNKTLFEEEKF